MKLADRLVKLVPCEDLNLVRRHEQILKDLKANRGKIDIINTMLAKLRHESIVNRNMVIMKTIAQTLGSDETGVVFLGHKHNPQGKMIHAMRDLYHLDVSEMNPHVRDKY